MSGVSLQGATLVFERDGGFWMVDLLQPGLLLLVAVVMGLIGLAAFFIHRFNHLD